MLGVSMLGVSMLGVSMLGVLSGLQSIWHSSLNPI